MEKELIEAAERFLREHRGKPDLTTKVGVSITHYPRYTYLLAVFCDENNLSRETYRELVKVFSNKYLRRRHSWDREKKE